MGNRRRPIIQRFTPISEQLRAIIADRGLAPCAVATAADVAPSVVTRFVNRERGLTGDSIDRIAEALGLRLVVGSRRGKALNRVKTDEATVPDGTV